LVAVGIAQLFAGTSHRIRGERLPSELRNAILVTFSFAGKTLYGNTGGSGGSGSWLAYLPEEKLALAYAANAKIYPG
jgi:CubicO group peptidase (beta-lactamase class C family)